MSKKAAIPIPYVIALIFGVVILAILGYWLTTQSTKVVGRGATTECDALIASFCQQWSITLFTIKPSVNFPAGCSEPKEDKCKTLLAFCGSAASAACTGKRIGDVCESPDDWGGVVRGTCKELGGTCYCQ